jgi:hypothetical protein
LAGAAHLALTDVVTYLASRTRGIKSAAPSSPGAMSGTTSVDDLAERDDLAF